MHQNPKRTETEIKLRIEDLRAVRTRLRDLGFRIIRRRIFESNVIFDQPGNPLRIAGSLLRLREAGSVCTLTYKGKSMPGKHKVREELETTVGAAEELRLILERLGYQKVFRYDKYRTEFATDKKEGVVVLDETPIGNYMEIEGSPASIDRVAKRLGFQSSKYITESYGALYLQYCRERELPPADMTFSKNKKPAAPSTKTA